jgi:PAS domain S-box-containing protein
MKDHEKSIGDLVNELAGLRTRVAELEPNKEPKQEIENLKLVEEALRASEANYQSIFNAVNDAIFVHGLETGEFVDVNEKGCELLGYSCNELIGLDLGSISSGEPPHSQEDAIQWLKKAAEGEPQLFEWMAKDKSGRMLWVEVNLKGAVIGGKDCLLAVVRDIDERKRMEKRLRESEAYLKGILQASPMGIGLVHNRVLSWVSDRMNEMLGYSQHELIGESARIAYESDEEFERVGRVKYAEIHERGIGSVETRLKRKDGGVIDVLLCSSVIDSADPSKGAIFTALDISERKQAEEALRESEHYFRSLLFGMHEDIVVIDRDYRITDVNNTFLVNVGRKSEEVIGQHCYEVSHGYNEPCEKKGEECMLREVFETGDPRSCHHQHIRTDGSKVWVDILLSPLRDESGDVTHVIEAIRDVTDLIEMEKVLRESEANFRALAENANDGILIAAGEGVHVYANKRAAEITGFSVAELTEIGLDELVAPDEVEKVADKYRRRVNGEGVPGQYETSLVRKSGEVFQVELSSARTVWQGKSAAIVLIRDITERKQVEEALRESEAELKVRVDELEEVNTALRVLLKRREEDKRELEEKIITNVKELVAPCLEKLKTTVLTAKQSAYVNTLESNLTDIISPFAQRLSSKYLNLTPTEIQIANLIKEGRTTKEIAEMQNSSSRTVEFHRKNIRKKIGIVNKRANLRSHLLSM